MRATMHVTHAGLLEGPMPFCTRSALHGHMKATATHPGITLPVLAIPLAIYGKNITDVKQELERATLHM